MRLTRVIAAGLIAGSLGVGVAEAQKLQVAGPPAEFPPASYTGKQYVDSRGCVYIRAGVDGAVTWVPRVGASRKHLCGYKPTEVAGTTKAPTQARKAPEVITLDGPAATPKAAAVAQPTPKPVPKAVRQPSSGGRKPIPTVAGTATHRPQPAPQIGSQPAYAPRPVTVAPTVTTRPAPVPAPVTTPAPVQPRTTTAPAAGGGCANASAFSQQFINRGADVRCGPQKEAPITYGKGWKNSALELTPGTRIVPRHVYEQRYHAAALSVPEGYRAAWDDDRLNLHRAERTAAPANVQGTVTVPSGYRMVDWDDDRLNPLRGPRTASGDAQTDAIWSQSLPRTLLPAPAPQVVVLPAGSSTYASAARSPGLFGSTGFGSNTVPGDTPNQAPRRMR